MIANRPDWTLSRQRQWGVPMAFFLHRETGALHPRTPELLEQVAQRIERGGIEAWQTLDPRELLGDEADRYEKNRDTLDVWFDSGTTHETVLRGSHAAQSTFPADLYLEGSDQHRGWFHSSLLTSCMINGIAPYKSLLTHGFVVDGDGRKMSKSLGNTLAPRGVRHARRGDPAPLGGVDRLRGRAVALRRDPEARRRGVPAGPQHAALPAVEPRRLRRRGRRGARRPDARDRPLDAGARRAVAGRDRRRLRTLRVPPDRLRACRPSAPRTSARSSSTC
jgi:isoleucyl-tRNA synthetase